MPDLRDFFPPPPWERLPASKESTHKIAVGEAYMALKELADAKMVELRKYGIKPPNYGIALVSVDELAQSLGLRTNSDDFAAIVVDLMATRRARGMPARDMRRSITVNIEARRLWKSSDRAGAGRAIKYLEFIP